MQVLFQIRFIFCRIEQNGVLGGHQSTLGLISFIYLYFLILFIIFSHFKIVNFFGYYFNYFYSYYFYLLFIILYFNRNHTLIFFFYMHNIL